ncbi:hypothetical protein D3C78_1205830 [compost metagenome]
MVVIAPLPLQVGAIDEIAEARVERIDVVVLGVDFDEGLPVEVVLGGQRLVITVVLESHVLGDAELFQVAANVALGIKQQALPAGQLGLVQVQARRFREVRRADQLAAVVVGPAVQVAHHVVAGAAPLVDQRLAVAADVGDQLDVAIDILQHLAVTEPVQRVIVAGIGHHQLVAVILRGIGEQDLLFQRVVRRIKVGKDRQLRSRSFQQLGRSQIRHYSHTSVEEDIRPAESRS